jgi:streptomycin 6-kinase
MTNLPSVTQTLLAQWTLRGDGEPVQRSGSMVLPVRTADGTPAVLKISLVDAGSEHEHLVLRRWGGNGAGRQRRGPAAER